MSVGHPWVDLWITPGNRHETVSATVHFGSAEVHVDWHRKELVSQWDKLAAQVREYLRRWDTSPMLPLQDMVNDAMPKLIDSVRSAPVPNKPAEQDAAGTD